MIVADHWYEQRDAGDGVVLLYEPHVNSWARCNVWYVRGRDRDLLIDSGSGLRPLSPALPRVAGQPVVAVATHIHFDHVGALHEFDRRCAHAAEAPHYAAMPDRETLAPYFRGLDRPVSALPAADWTPADYRVEPAPIDVTLVEGDVIDLGDRRYTVLHLPGHSPGSIGFFDERAGILFSGDALYDGELLDELERSDVAQYCATMQRLRALEIRIGHGGHCASFDHARKNVLVDQYLAGRRRQGCPAAPARG
jgi:glyoxylase-like metal-dependent hydrolase (beta-lactamase superfamily II)